MFAQFACMQAEMQAEMRMCSVSDTVTKRKGALDNICVIPISLHRSKRGIRSNT